MNEEVMKKEVSSILRLPCIMIEGDPLPHEEWIKAGRPIMLKRISSKGKAVLFKDAAYGHLFLFIGNRLIDHGRDYVKGEFRGTIYVGLSEYYGYAEGLYSK